MKENAGRAASLALVACLAAWALVLRPLALGGGASYVMIRGSSMLPTYETGDLVIALATSEYHTGDVVAYRVPAGDVGAGHVVVHRIVGGDGARGFLTRGDNNPAVDPWMPRASDVVGRSWLRAPQLGRVVALVHQPASLGALAAAIAVAFVVLRPSSGSRPARPGREHSPRLVQDGVSLR